VRRYGALVRGSPEEEELSANLQALYEGLWSPIGQVLPSQIKRIIISPDGQVNFISFATLLSKDSRFLSQTYDVQYVASVRDLLREHQLTTAKEVILFANPDFGLASTPMQNKGDNQSSDLDSKSIRGNEKRDVEDWRFESLTGTQREGDELIKEFADWVGDLPITPRNRRQRNRSSRSIHHTFCIWPPMGFSLRRIRVRPEPNPKRC